MNLINLFLKVELFPKLNMESLLEQQRCYHEEMERMMDALVGEKMAPKKSHKDFFKF